MNENSENNGKSIMTIYNHNVFDIIKKQFGLTKDNLYLLQRSADYLSFPTQTSIQEELNSQLDILCQE